MSLKRNIALILIIFLISTNAFSFLSAKDKQSSGIISLEKGKDQYGNYYLAKQEYYAEANAEAAKIYKVPVGTEILTHKSAKYRCYDEGFYQIYEYETFDANGKKLYSYNYPHDSAPTLEITPGTSDSLFKKLICKGATIEEINPIYQLAAAEGDLTEFSNLVKELYEKLKTRKIDNETTNGTNYRSYMAALQYKIKNKWEPQRTSKSHGITAKFKVNVDGTISNLKLIKKSKYSSCNKAALEAINEAAPFAPLPKWSKEPIEIEFSFDYEVGTKKK